MVRFFKPLFIVLLIAFSLTDCRKKKIFNEDIDECDSIGNYYEENSHYINRNIVTDEGVIDYKKLLHSYHGKGSVCNPDKIELE